MSHEHLSPIGANERLAQEALDRNQAEADLGELLLKQEREFLAMQEEARAAFERQQTERDELRAQGAAERRNAEEARQAAHAEGVKGRLDAAGPANDAAELRLYGSRGRTYTDPETGKVIADANHQVRGRLEEMHHNPRYGKTQAERDATAKAYEETLNGLLDDGLELAQAEMIADKYQDSFREVAKMTGKFMAEGMDPAAARDRAEELYDRKLQRFEKDIREEGIVSHDQYRQFIDRKLGKISVSEAEAEEPKLDEAASEERSPEEAGDQSEAAGEGEESSEAARPPLISDDVLTGEAPSHAAGPAERSDPADQLEAPSGAEFAEQPASPKRNILDKVEDFLQRKFSRKESDGKPSGFFGWFAVRNRDGNRPETKITAHRDLPNAVWKKIQATGSPLVNRISDYREERRTRREEQYARWDEEAARENNESPEVEAHEPQRDENGRFESPNNGGIRRQLGRYRENRRVIRHLRRLRQAPAGGQYQHSPEAVGDHPEAPRDMPNGSAQQDVLVYPPQREVNRDPLLELEEMLRNPRRPR